MALLRHRPAALILMGALAGFAMRTPAHGVAPSEHEVKAAYLFNFASFVQWPAGAFPSGDAPLTICVLGADPFGAVLDVTLADERIEGRALVARRLASLRKGEDCQIVFVPAAEKQHLPGLLRTLDARPVLTVGESDGFARQGGMIGFLLEAGTVRFEVNVDAVEHAGLKVSAHLLNLARLVGSQKPLR